jgi:hypothetical protein
MEEFLHIDHIIRRDTQVTEHDLYQIQAEKNNNSCRIVYLGKYNDVPIVPIFDKKIDDYDCSLVSFVVTKDELINHDDYNMIGFLISKNKNIGASLMLSFVPNKKIDINSLVELTCGKFEINLIKKWNGKIIKENIETYSEYIGKEESIYLLTELLLDVIEREKE